LDGIKKATVTFGVTVALHDKTKPLKVWETFRLCGLENLCNASQPKTAGIRKNKHKKQAAERWQGQDGPTIARYSVTPQ
jgi:hypothetical protein